VGRPRSIRLTSTRRKTMADHVATAEADIDAPGEKVWDALTDPEQIKQYMFGSTVSTDWKPGSPIVWKGEYEGKTYEDRGEIVEVERPRRLELTHFSSASGLEDRPENYHTLVYELEERDGKTHLSLSQDNNPTEEAADRSRANWETMLESLKQVVEGR
jgi:uncharacterized protein YndB with AHSA1/START domain